jgi:hypothetical protein
MGKGGTTRKPSTGLVRAGQLDLLKEMVQETAPITRAQSKLLSTAETIFNEPPDPEDLAFLARELVQCTLPHSDPGQVPFWARTNGHVTLSIVSGFDPKRTRLVGYPYGSIPRLILFWLTTEALRSKSQGLGRRLYLGDSYNEFLRDIGFDPNTGGGKRGDGARVKEQTRRLFASTISFIQTGELLPAREGERRLNMTVAEASELWWDPKHPDQINLWDSWIEIGEKLFEAITAAPVPADRRALRVLKRSPLALDLYAWATHKSLSVARKGKPQFVPWRGLKDQFGADYNDIQNFRRKAEAALKKIQAVYPGLKLSDATGGIIVEPTSRPAIPLKPKALFGSD